MHMRPMIVNVVLLGVGVVLSAIAWFVLERDHKNFT